MIACALLAMLSCMSQEPKKPIEPIITETGIPLDRALSEIVSYYVENLPANTKLALISFNTETQLLSDYIFEELWIHFEDSLSFILIDRKNLELIQKELDYQYSGM
jgi:hypothetical protein